MIREAISQLISGGTLSEAEAYSVMEEIMTGVATPSQLGAFLTALRVKGETSQEVTGLARGMRSQAVHVSLPAHLRAVDTCGTGGDASGTFNVSTAPDSSSPAWASLSRSTAIVLQQAGAAAQTCSRRWASGWNSAQNRWRAA